MSWEAESWPVPHAAPGLEAESLTTEPSCPHPFMGEGGRGFAYKSHDFRAELRGAGPPGFQASPPALHSLIAQVTFTVPRLCATLGQGVGGGAGQNLAPGEVQK